MNKLKSYYDTGSAAAPASAGMGLNDQPPWMTNTTPKAQMASVGAAKVQMHPDLVLHDVRIPNNYLKK